MIFVTPSYVFQTGFSIVHVMFDFFQVIQSRAEEQEVRMQSVL